MMKSSGPLLIFTCLISSNLCGQHSNYHIKILPAFHREILIIPDFDFLSICIHPPNYEWSDTASETYFLDIELSEVEFDFITEWLYDLKNSETEYQIKRDSIGKISGIPPPPFLETDGILLEITPSLFSNKEKDLISDKKATKCLLNFIKKHSSDSRELTEALKDCFRYF